MISNKGAERVSLEWRGLCWSTHADLKRERPVLAAVFELRRSITRLHKSAESITVIHGVIRLLVARRELLSPLCRFGHAFAAIMANQGPNFGLHRACRIKVTCALCGRALVITAYYYRLPLFFRSMHFILEGGLESSDTRLRCWIKLIAIYAL